MKSVSNASKAIIATSISHTIWGFSFMASRVALDKASVFVLLSHRFLSAYLAMLLLRIILRLHIDYKNKRIFRLFLLGMAQPVIYFLGEQYGILHSNTIFSGVMIATIPIAATLAAWPLLKEMPSGGQLFYSLLSVAGVIGIGLLSSSSGKMDLIGLAGLLVAVVSAAAYALLNRSLSKDFTPFQRTYGMMLLGAAVFTALALWELNGDMTAYLAPLKTPLYLGSVLYLSLLASVLCFFLSGYALSHLTIARESVFNNLTTSVSVFAGAVFLKEPFSWLSLLFCFLILFGIWGVQRKSKG